MLINRELEDRDQEQSKQIKNAERTGELEHHHRIKNNLQVISSLLNLQSEKFEDEKVNEAFRDTLNRVVSMSLIHQKLYRTKELESINLKSYIEDLVSYLTGLYREKNANINIDVQNLNFGIDTIIPLGMIINELVFNSLKYAFSGDRQSTINIELYQDDKGYYTLIVTDNGRGIPEDIDIKDSDSLGLQLVNSLIDQINGDFELDKNNGTRFIIKFDGQ
ncbi:MAG: sensor histidine kinase [Methanohalobium sp.]|uniref:sensor histidine kinase n=1 Tax=Methanohalobium sp. TaxID=2837493 RepID=UPI003978180F